MRTAEDGRRGDGHPEIMAGVQVVAAGYTNTTSKGFANAVSRLSSLGFVEYPERGMVRAAPLLFLEDSR